LIRLVEKWIPTAVNRNQFPWENGHFKVTTTVMLPKKHQGNKTHFVQLIKWKQRTVKQEMEHKDKLREI